MIMDFIHELPTSNSVSKQKTAKDNSNIYIRDVIDRDDFDSVMEIFDVSANYPTYSAATAAANNLSSVLSPSFVAEAIRSDVRSSTRIKDFTATPPPATDNATTAPPDPPATAIVPATTFASSSAAASSSDGIFRSTRSSARINPHTTTPATDTNTVDLNKYVIPTYYENRLYHFNDDVEKNKLAAFYSERYVNKADTDVDYYENFQYNLLKFCEVYKIISSETFRYKLPLFTAELKKVFHNVFYIGKLLHFYLT
jgi:hypothetical protein